MGMGFDQVIMQDNVGTHQIPQYSSPKFTWIIRVVALEKIESIKA
jgi:hypothetical protein